MYFKNKLTEKEIRFVVTGAGDGGGGIERRWSKDTNFQF